METAGPDDNVIKLIPPLNIALPALRHGLEILQDAVDSALGHEAPGRPSNRPSTGVVALAKRGAAS